MKNLPRRGWALLGSLGLFMIVVTGVLAWAGLSGEAGSQRGLVIHNELPLALIVSIDDQQALIDPGLGATFVVKREQFPAIIRWGAPNASTYQNEELQYRDVVDAEFRLSIDENGIYRTADYRDTPVPKP